MKQFFLACIGTMVERRLGWAARWNGIGGLCGIEEELPVHLFVAATQQMGSKIEMCNEEESTRETTEI